MAETIYQRIEEELKKKQIKKKDVATKLDYKNTSGFTNAMKRGTLRLKDFIIITDMLDMHPMDFFPKDTKLHIYDMTLYDIIKAVFEQEIKIQLEKKGDK